MQPEDPKSEFKTPEQSSYYAAPTLPEAEVRQPEVGLTEALPEESAPAQSESTSLEQKVKPEDEPASTSLPTMEPIKWEAPEYIHHDKDLIWYVIFGVVVVVIMVVAILTQAWTFAVLVPVMAASLFIYTHRPTQQNRYVLSAKGLYINDILHPYAEFKAFGVIRDGDVYSLMFIPVRRFRPGVSVYFPKESGEAIVDALGVRIPMKEVHLDAFDKMIRLLRI